MMNSMRGSDDRKLDALFEAYREACPTPEASANFMPNLWEKIGTRQRVTFSFSRMAGAFVTAALALSFALGVYLSMPVNSPAYSQSYVEALDADRDPVDLFEPVRYEVR
jgi:hypothetical protein